MWSRYQNQQIYCIFVERRYEKIKSDGVAPDPFRSLYGGVEPSNADVCFIVGGCKKPSINTKECTSLGYTRTSCDSEREIVYDTCVSKGEKYVKCTCNPNYYMLTGKPSNAEAYDIEECTKVDGKKLYRATCKSDYKYSLSTITRENGKTNSRVCDTGKTPVTDGGICTMLYGPNANKVLYKDCDCNSTYKYKKETLGFSYSGACTYKYGDNATTTLYSSVTCDATKGYISTSCSGNMKEDKKVVHSAANVTCRTCKAPACPICKSWQDCIDTYFDINVLHPLGGDITLNTSFNEDSNGCWYPIFQSCTDIRLKQDEPYRDYPSTEIPGMVNGVVSSVKCIADCEVFPINGYNTEEQCKEKLPSTKKCKQVTYTGKSSVEGYGDLSNLGSRSLTCYVREAIKCPSGYTLGTCPSGKTCDTQTAENDASKTCYKEKTCATVFAEEIDALHKYLDLTFTAWPQEYQNSRLLSDTRGTCTYSEEKYDENNWYYVDGAIGYCENRQALAIKYKPAIDEKGKPLDLSYSESKTCGKTQDWLDGKVDYKCVPATKDGLTCYHLVRKTCEDYAKEGVLSYDYKNDRTAAYLSYNYLDDGDDADDRDEMVNRAAKKYDYKAIDRAQYHARYDQDDNLSYGLVGYDANEGLGDEVDCDDPDNGRCFYLADKYNTNTNCRKVGMDTDCEYKYKITDTNVGIVCGFSVTPTSGGSTDNPQQDTFSCFGKAYPWDDNAFATAAKLCRGEDYTTDNPNCFAYESENCPCAPAAGIYLKYKCLQ